MISLFNKKENDCGNLRTEYNKKILKNNIYSNKKYFRNQNIFVYPTLGTAREILKTYFSELISTNYSLNQNLYPIENYIQKNISLISCSSRIGYDLLHELFNLKHSELSKNILVDNYETKDKHLNEFIYKGNSKKTLLINKFISLDKNVNLKNQNGLMLFDMFDVTNESDDYKINYINEVCKMIFCLLIDKEYIYQKNKMINNNQDLISIIEKREYKSHSFINALWEIGSIGENVDDNIKKIFFKKIKELINQYEYLLFNKNNQQKNIDDKLESMNLLNPYKIHYKISDLIKLQSSIMGKPIMINFHILLDKNDESILINKILMNLLVISSNLIDESNTKLILVQDFIQNFIEDYPSIISKINVSDLIYSVPYGFLKTHDYIKNKIKNIYITHELTPEIKNDINHLFGNKILDEKYIYDFHKISCDYVMQIDFEKDVIYEPYEVKRIECNKFNKNNILDGFWIIENEM